MASPGRKGDIRSLERNCVLYLQDVRDFVQRTHNFSDVDSCLCFLHHIDAVLGTSNLCQKWTGE